VPYVLLLLLFASTAEQYHKAVSVSAKIDPVAGSEVEAVLMHARSNTLRIREIALLHAGDGYRHLRSRWSVETIKPFPVRTAAVSSDILADLDQSRR